MRILILGDSLVVPRPHRGQPLESTWPVLVKNGIPGCEIWQRARPASTIHEVTQEFNLFSDSLDAFDAMVVQVGITDCCPRPDPLILHKFLQTFCSKRIQKLVTSNYHVLLKLRCKTWVSKSIFEQGIRSIIETSMQSNPKLALLFITIGPPCHDFIEKVPPIAKSVREYNEIFDKISDVPAYRTQVAIINPYKSRDVDTLFLKDGHHLTTLGHEAVAQEILSHLKR